jgi:hypothetical protein
MIDDSVCLACVCTLAIFPTAAPAFRLRRCFPHCCPRHSEYRGCGAPISIRLTTIASTLCSGNIHSHSKETKEPYSFPNVHSTSMSHASSSRFNFDSTLQESTLIAFARLASCTDVMFEIGSSVRLSTFTMDLRTRDNLIGTWLQGREEITNV